MKNAFIFHPVHMESTVVHLRERFGLAATQVGVLPVYFKNFEAMLRRISSYTDEQAEAAAYDFTSREMQTIATYIGVNIFKLNIHPMSVILKKHKSKSLFPRIYTSWKRAYDDKDVISTISDYIWDEGMADAVSKFNLDLNLWIAWTSDSSDCAQSIAQTMIKDREPIEALEKYRIFKIDPLYHAVKNARLLCCEKQEYRTYTSERLSDIFKTFTQSQQHRFIHRFLTVGFTRDELFEYRNLNQFICMQYTYAYDPPKRSPFWQTALPEEIQLFHRWRLLCNITLAFGHDERSRYWMGYLDQIEDAYTAKTPYQDTGYRIAMIFRSFVVIDFTEIGYAARIVNRDFYQRNISNYFEIPVQIKNSELRSLMPREMLIDRIQHNEGWQSRTDVLLRDLIRRSN